VKFPSKGSESESIRVEGTESLVASIVAAIETFVSQRENQVVDTVEVPVEKHRKLIGRGGEIRRNLEERFGVSVDIPKNGSGHTAVKLSGAAEDVSKAKAHISDMVKEPEGETILVPKSLHHTIAQNGNIFRKLRNDYGVTVDHGGQKPPPRPAAGAPPTRANGGAPPLITDEPDSATHSWKIVVPEATNGDAGTIPWILVGQSPEKLASAKSHVETALETASKPTATGYLILADPRSHRHVIGAGGRTINAIRRKTGCDIQVPRAASGNGQEAIVIVGEEAGCEEAKDMILDAVHEGESQR
jgi:polyribonucleotide nucleotidyltransferase